MSDPLKSAALTDDSTASPQDPPPRRALLSIFFVVFMDLLGFGIIIPLLPRYVPNYESNPLKVTALFSVYSICQFIGAPILGVISDRFGRRPVLVLSQVGSAAGYCLLGVATQFVSDPSLTLGLVYLSRIIDGFTGGNISTAQAYIGDVTTPANRAKGMGMLGAAFGIGFAFGPFMGGVLGHFNVALPAYVAAGLSLVAAGMSYFWLPESRVHHPSESQAWLHPSRFVSVLKNPILANLLFLGFAIMAGFVMMESTMVLYLNNVFHYRELGTGLFFGFAGLVIIIVQAGFIGKLTSRFGDWNIAIVGSLLVCLGMAGYAATSVLTFLPVLLLTSAMNATGRSFQQPTLSSLISNNAGRQNQGIAFGMFHGLGSLARVIGPLIAGQAFRWKNWGAFVVASVLALVCAIWMLGIRRKSLDSHAALPAEVISEAGATVP